MTPQERRRVEELFDRLATLEDRPRDPEAERAIMDGLRLAPNAVYPLVQTVLLQDEALRKADERIRVLEEEGPQQGGGFLDTMRDTIFGGGERPRGAVPEVRGERPMGVPPGFRNANAGTGHGGPPPQAEASRGGSFLGTAAAAAVGVIGGSMLLNSIRGMMGTGQSQTAAAGDFSGGSQGSPWGDASSSDLARQAGIDHIGGGNREERAGLFDSNEQPFDMAEAEDDDFGFDLDGDIG